MAKKDKTKKTLMLEEPVRPKCSCGFKIRGANHEDGAHHKGTVPRCVKR